MTEVKDYGDWIVVRYLGAVGEPCCNTLSFSWEGPGSLPGEHKMVIVATFPVIVSALLSAAHFYRSGSLVLAVVSILLPLLLVSKSHWVPRVITVALLLASCEWVRTMMFFIEQYEKAGISWTRLAIILSGVALFTAFSATVFMTPAMKRRYRHVR